MADSLSHSGQSIAQIVSDNARNLTSSKSVSSEHAHRTRPKAPPLVTSNLEQFKTSTVDLESARVLANGKHGWEQGVFRRMPVLGLAALVGVLLSNILSIIVGIRSNGTLVSSWSISPNTILALASAISNALLSFTFAIGMTISWWRKALNGTTLQQLYEQWKRGNNFFVALSSFELSNPIVLAAVFTSAAMFDGPLLQRALTIKTLSSPEPNAIRPFSAKYETDYRFLVAGVSLGMTAFIAVSATFYGWWELGRKVTINPLDTGKAFGSPILKSNYVSSYASMSDVMSEIGHTEVKYGAIYHEVATTWEGGLGGKSTYYDGATKWSPAGFDRSAAATTLASSALSGETKAEDDYGTKWIMDLAIAPSHLVSKPES